MPASPSIPLKLTNGQVPKDKPPFRIARDGTWFYLGSPIERKELVKLFATILRCEEDGRYWLVTPVERVEVTVEDAPFLAVDCRADGKGEAQTLTFTTNVEREVAAGEAHPIVLKPGPAGEDAVPYLTLERGLEAVLSRGLYYRLAEMAVPRSPEETLHGVWSGGRFFPLGDAEGGGETA